MGSMGEPRIPYVDVLIVGAGIGAFTLANRLRKNEFNVKVYERGSASGGIWHWNCYPGARVDSESPIYQLFDRELYEDFTFKERYCEWTELRRYFKHVEKKWNTDAYIEYHKNVETAVFQEDERLWYIKCSDGSQLHAQWFVPCVGFASKHYTPPFPGLENFRGDLYHTAQWPQQGVDFKGKRVALVGTGASGIQVAQEIGNSVKDLTIYQRTPNLCLPMRQWNLDPEVERKKKEDGFEYSTNERNTFQDSVTERDKFFQGLWSEGGFRPLLGAYKDMLTDPKANAEAYKFWRRTILPRVRDPEKQRLLAPEKPYHPFGTKRHSLETRFYEVVDQDHVDIIDVNENPLEEVTPTGLRTKKGLVEVDVVILATGFDSSTGSLAQMDIRGTTGGTVGDHWKDGLKTSMGIALPTFPNMLFLYGPQAPTAFANGPSCTQLQAEWVERLMKQCREDNIKRFEAKEDAQNIWGKRVHEQWYKTLFPLAKSSYTGSNIPGKRIEPMNWIGGLVTYMEELYKSLDNDYQGWHTA